MKDFKFFQKGTVEDSQMLNESTFITASFNDDTPEGHMGRRRLYHTDIDLYGRLRQSNNEMDQRDLNDNPIRLFQTTTVTKVKETFWTKFKDVMRESWRVEPVAVVVASVLTTLIITVTIAKLLGL